VIGQRCNCANITRYQPRFIAKMRVNGCFMGSHGYPNIVQRHQQRAAPVHFSRPVIHEASDPNLATNRAHSLVVAFAPILRGKVSVRRERSLKFLALGSPAPIVEAPAVLLGVC
jgi:hypothetical protein